MPQAGFRAAVAPLLSEGALEAVEWTVDMGFGHPIPPSAAAVIAAFGPAGRLWAHGVGYSPMSAGRDDLAEAWLAHLAHDVERHRYRSVSEHFGWCTAGDAISGPPLPVPRTAATLAVAKRRLARLAAVAGVRVGLENLALAFSRSEALEHGDFLREIVEAADGYVHLDLHNLWCQAANFDLSPAELLASYPLDRVHVVHVAGGSWVAGVRRDTHDDRVPEEVWGLLRDTLPQLPNVEVVFVERIGLSFTGPEATTQYADDYARLRSIRDEVYAG